MIPEVGTPEEFKEVFHRLCSAGPLVGEIYLIKIGPPPFEYTMRVSMVTPDFVRLWNIAGNCEWAYTMDNWMQHWDCRSVKFLGYAT